MNDSQSDWFRWVRHAKRIVAIAAILCLSAITGCSSSGPASPMRPKDSSFAQATQESVFAARLQSMAAADTYVTVTVQALDEMRAHTARSEVSQWAMEQRIATAMASYTNATGPNGYVGLLDMLVLSTLKRMALEEHWIPVLLKEDGQPMVEAFRRGEREVWALGAKVLSEKQLQELREVIQRWRQENPTQYYVGYIRFTDFANAMHITPGAKANSRSSVFGLLYMDPLAGLDPVARELQEYRGLTERLNFFINRMPVILGWQIDLSVHRAIDNPQVTRFVDNTGRFANATTQFSAAVARYPKEFSAERVAAIDQALAGVDQQRSALMKDLESHEHRIDESLGKVSGIVERAQEAGKSINVATSQTIGTAEDGARRTLILAFGLAIALIVFGLLFLLLYRLAIKRWGLQTEPH